MKSIIIRERKWIHSMVHRHIAALLISVCALLLFHHAVHAAILLDRVVAVVNKEVITWSELYRIMERDFPPPDGSPALVSAMTASIRTDWLGSDRLGTSCRRPAANRPHAVVPAARDESD